MSKNKKLLMLRLLLNHYHGGTIEAKALPEEEAKNVAQVSIQSDRLGPLLKNPLDKLSNIHYSWLIKKLENLEKDKIPLILSLFPDEDSKKLRTFLDASSKPFLLTSLGRSFFLSKLYPLFLFDEALPLDYLLESSLSFLAQLKKNDLIEMIDFLGLFDLAEEIQHIVDKHLLEQIYGCFPSKKQVFLRKCLHQKEKLVTQRMKLEHWDGDEKKLKKLLHHKGLVRLAYAISGESPDLIWHINHILDTGRGMKLERLCQKSAIPGVTEALKKQVLIINKFFKQTAKNE